MNAGLVSQLFAAVPGETTVLPAPTLPGTPSRRLKLWDLDEKYHCPVIGTCVQLEELVRLAKRFDFSSKLHDEFALHVEAVNYSLQRNEFFEALQKHLERKYAMTVKRFNAARSDPEVLALWRESLSRGEVAAPVWATLTHKHAGTATRHVVYADIHMLSHQVGAAARADLRQLEQYRSEATRLRDEVAALRRDMSEAQHAHERTLATLRRDLAAAEQRAARHERNELELAAAARARKEHRDLQQRAAALATRAEVLEEWNVANARRAAQLELDLVDARAELAAAEEALARALGVPGEEPGTAGCERDRSLEAELAGRCVLCVGGRSGLVDGYRKLVEYRGGSFLHHDGGQEESLHRIDAAVANADAVVCQSACISHAAYWRLKDACKKLGKPCVFVRSPGVGSFARCLTTLTRATPSEKMIRISP